MGDGPYTNFTGLGIPDSPGYRNVCPRAVGAPAEGWTGIWKGCLSLSAITSTKWMGSCAKWHGHPFSLKGRWSQVMVSC